MEIKDNFYISFLLGIIVAMLIMTGVNSVLVYESNKKMEEIKKLQTEQKEKIDSIYSTLDIDKIKLQIEVNTPK